MRRSLTACCFVLCVAGVLAQPAAAQAENRTLYLQIDYMRVPPGGNNEYLQMEQELYKPIHRERVRRGLIVDWSVYRVLLASPDTPYNFATINVYDDIAKLANSYQGVLSAVQDMDALMERTLAAREIVHTELWQVVESVQRAGASAPSGRYLVFTFMEAPSGGGGQYVAMEREVWRAFHQDRIGEGVMSGWGLYDLVLPAGAAMRYNFGTVNYYEHMGHVVAPFSEGLLRRAHPDASAAEVSAMLERTVRTRSIHKAELWELVDSANSRN